MVNTERINMECRATIRDFPEGKFTVTFGSRSPSDRVYDNFEDAYSDACEYVNWYIDKVTIKVYPQFVNDIMKKVDFERNKALYQAKYEEAKQVYLSLKERFEGK